MRFRLIPHRLILSFLINNKLGIFAVFLVGADQEEVRTRGYTEATVAAGLTFKLTAEVGCVIVKEFYLLSVWEGVFQIDKTSRQYVKAFDLWQSLDVKQGVEFRDDLRFEFLKLFLAAQVNILLPKVHGEIAVGIAPSAVMLIERAVFFAADVGVLERHTAAFTDQLSGTAEESIDRHVKQLGERFKRFGVGYRFAVLPTRNRLTGDEYLFGKLVLGELVLCSEFKDDIFGFHSATAFVFCGSIIADPKEKNKQHAVAIQPSKY